MPNPILDNDLKRKYLLEAGVNPEQYDLFDDGTYKLKSTSVNPVESPTPAGLQTTPKSESPFERIRSQQQAIADEGKKLFSLKTVKESALQATPESAMTVAGTAGLMKAAPAIATRIGLSAAQAHPVGRVATILGSLYLASKAAELANQGKMTVPLSDQTLIDTGTEGLNLERRVRGMSPEEWTALQQERQALFQQNPNAAMIGGAIPNLIAFKPSLAGVKAVPRLLTPGGVATLNPVEKAALLNMTVGAGLSTIPEIGQQVKQGEFSPGRLALAAGIGGLISEPNKLVGQRLGFEPSTQERPLSLPDEQKQTLVKTPDVESAQVPQPKDVELKFKARELKLTRDRRAKEIESSVSRDMESKRQAFRETLPDVSDAQFEVAFNAEKQRRVNDKVSKLNEAVDKAVKEADDNKPTAASALRDFAEMDKNSEFVYDTDQWINKLEEGTFHETKQGLLAPDLAQQEAMKKAVEEAKLKKQITKGEISSLKLADETKKALKAKPVVPKVDLGLGDVTKTPETKPTPEITTNPDYTIPLEGNRQMVKFGEDWYHKDDLGYHKITEPELIKTLNDKQVGYETKLQTGPIKREDVAKGNVDLMSVDEQRALLGHGIKTITYDTGRKTPGEVVGPDVTVAAKLAPDINASGRDATTGFHEAYHKMTEWVKRLADKNPIAKTYARTINRAEELAKRGDQIIADNPATEANIRKQLGKYKPGEIPEESSAYGVGVRAEELSRLRTSKEYGNQLKRWWYDYKAAWRTAFGKESLDDLNRWLARRLLDDPNYYESGAAVMDMKAAAGLVPKAMYGSVKGAGYKQAEEEGRTIPSIYSHDPYQYYRFSDAESGVLPRFAALKDGESAPITEVFKHDKLFQEYPAAKNLTIKVDNSINADGDYFKGVIRVNKSRTKDWRSVILHEIQHNIDDIEGVLKSENIDAQALHRYTIAKYGQPYFDLNKEYVQIVTKDKRTPEDNVRLESINKKLAAYKQAAMNDSNYEDFKYKYYRSKAAEVRAWDTQETSKLTEDELAQSPPYKEGLRDTGVRPEDVREMSGSVIPPRDFITSTEKEFTKDRPFGLIPNRDGSFNSSDVIAKFRGLPAGEQEILGEFPKWLREQGGRVSRESVDKWMSENGPKVKVVSYGQEGKVSEARKALDTLSHELDSIKGAGYILYNRLAYDPFPRTIKDVFSGVKKTLEWDAISDEVRGKLENYVKLKHQVLTEPPDTSPRATSFYNTISAFDTKKYPVQRVDVVIPKMSDAEADAKGIPSRKSTTLWQQDNLHENLPNTLGWAMIQYKTLPSGEKVAFIGELQSRWGQEARKAKETNEAGGIQHYRGFSESIQHPLLRDYNRLILKAAINQARRDGVTKIAISDAETAMMTEGHDLAAYAELMRNNRKVVVNNAINKELAKSYLREKNFESYYGSYAEKIKNIAEGKRVLLSQKEAVDFNLEGFKLEIPSSIDILGSVSQEPGMRFNYDTALPQIAKDLTGDSGIVMDFGPHKNALTKEPIDRTIATHEGDDSNYRTIPRKNLIFQNPDGTPKTSVTARVYDISKAAEAPFTLFGKRNMTGGIITANDLLRPLDKDTLPSDSPLARRLAFWRPEVEKMKDVNRPVGEAAEKFYDEYTDNYGQYVNRPLMSAGRLMTGSKAFIMNDSPSAQKVVRYMYDMFDSNGKSTISLTPAEQSVVDDLRDYFKQVGTERNSRTGMDTANLHYGELNPFYFPQVVKSGVLQAIFERPNSIEAKRLKNDFMSYQESLGLDPEVEWKKFMGGYIKEGGVKLAQQFGPLDKSASVGLPPSWRETRLYNILAKYGERVARRFAYFDNIESKPDIIDALDNTELKGNKAVMNVMENISGFRDLVEAKREVSAGLVRAGMLQAQTGLTDLLSAPFLSLQHQDLRQVIPALAKSISNIADNIRASKEAGVNRINITSLESNDIGEAEIISGMRRTRDLLSNISLRNATEQLSRGVTYGIGNWTINDAIAAVKMNRASAQQKKVISDFLRILPEEAVKMNISPEDIQKATARFVESVQGTYDYRGLPALTQKGTFSPFLALSRFNVEKLNNFNKHVWTPLLAGNPKPFLMATLGAVIGGNAVLELRRQLSGRKEKAPEFKEIEAMPEAQVKALMYRAFALTEASSYTGVLGTLGKQLMDKVHGNRNVGMNNVLWDAMNQTAQTTLDYVDAVNNGEAVNSLDYLERLAQNNLQNYRIYLRLSDPEYQRELDMNKKTRDLRTFRQLEGKNVSDVPTEFNPFEGAASRKFKRAATVEEAAKYTPSIVDQAIAKSRINGVISPEELIQQMRKLSTMQYQTIPDPSRNPSEYRSYMKFLNTTQGVGSGKKLTEDWLRQRMENERKKALLGQEFGRRF